MRVSVLLMVLLTMMFNARQSAAASMVIYRCTDAFGALTLQNGVACPKGSRQQKQVIQPPPPMPAYRPVAQPKPSAPAAIVAGQADVPPASVTPESSPTIIDSDRLPPPALYQCNTYDNDSYLNESATPAPRCVRLQTTDLAGTVDNGAGVACQMVTDQCQRVADGAACAAWRRRQRESEAALKFGQSDEADANRIEYERVLKIVRDSTCGK